MKTHNESTRDKLESAISERPEIKSWQEIDWKVIERNVFKLQQRIFRAENLKQTRKVRKLQRLLLKSQSALLLATRQVTQLNKGKRTEGVDGVKSLTETQRVELYNKMKKHNVYSHTPSPARRTYIMKNNNPKKLRPLGIPTIKDRIYQKLVLMALEPQWEERFESTSYGFRPKRSAHDAIDAIYTKVNKGKDWVFEGDFKGCFDNLNHEHIMEQIKYFPCNELILKWLKAGYIDNNVFNETNKGTPQGGIISPLLANIALHGMEEALNIQYEYSPKYDSYQVKRRVNEDGDKTSYSVVRYADDFVILCDTEKEARRMYDKLKPYLEKRGLELATDKTKITTVTKGFDFLGFNIKRYKYFDKKKNKIVSKMLIKPSKKSMNKFKNSLRNEYKKLQGKNVADLISRLNPIIRGTANYWKPQVASRVFDAMDNYMFFKNLKFVRRLHPKKNKKWITDRYFKTDKTGQSNDRWLLTDPIKGTQLRKMGWTSIVRTSTIKWKNTPYNAKLKDYFIERDIKTFKHDNIETRIKLAEMQNYKCPLCGQSLINGEGAEVHHKMPRCHGGLDTYKNMSLVHISCHIAWHKTFPANGPLPDEHQAKNWLGIRGIQARKKILRENGFFESKYKDNPEIFNAYTDGSYNEKNDSYGIGLVAYYKGNKEEYSIKGTRKEFTRYRNVAGETEATITAIERAIKLKAKKIVIYHNYEGISKWCTEEWKAKSDFSRMYKSQYDKLKDKIEIVFLWSKTYMGYKHDKVAEELAKRAIELDSKAEK